MRATSSRDPGRSVPPETLASLLHLQRLVSWRRHVASLTLLGVAVALCASCGAPRDAPGAQQNEAGTEQSVTSAQPKVRSLVLQVAGMRKSQGGST